MITENTKAILLLTSFFNSNEIKEYKTLTINEYGYFACWLHQNGFKPVDLLIEDAFDNIFAAWDEQLSHVKAKQIIDFARLENTIAQIAYDRVKGLLNRGASLSLALDKWQSAGVWIMDRQHHHYPKSIKKQLKHQSPAILFGVGNSELLTKQAIGFVGSRDCNIEDERATNQYVEKVNLLNYQVVSGGAKGVDTHAMLASLKNGHTAIGILSDSLFRSSAASQWRQHLKANNLVLISPFFPEGKFTPANAMTRNKFIYLLSNATVVVTSGEKGGTWEGAKENLKKDWVPLLISTHQEPLQKGNQALINGDGLGRTKVKALAVSPTTSPEQFSGLLQTEQSYLLKDINNISDIRTNIGIQNTSQDDLFSMPENLELESLVSAEEVVATTILNNETDKIIEKKIPELIHNTPEETEIKVTRISDDVNETPIIKTVQIEGVIKGKAEENVEMIEPKSTDKLIQEQIVTPLLDNFYQQLYTLIEKQPQQKINKNELDKHFPEFEIMGKQALDKLLKHLIDQGKLVKPHARKKLYTLP